MRRPLLAAVACAVVYPAVLFLAARLYSLAGVPVKAYALMAFAGAVLGFVVYHLRAVRERA
jgi:hypothetical protein